MAGRLSHKPANTCLAFIVFSQFASHEVSSENEGSSEIEWLTIRSVARRIE